MVQVNQATGTNLAMAMNVASATAGTTSNPLQQALLQTPTASTNQSSMFSSISGIFAPLSGYMNPSASSQSLSTQSMSTQSPSTAYKTPQKSTYQYREETALAPTFTPLSASDLRIVSQRRAVIEKAIQDERMKRRQAKGTKTV